MRPPSLAQSIASPVEINLEQTYFRASFYKSISTRNTRLVKVVPMQTIWTRALQVKSSCRCPSCARPQRAISRRVATAPARHRFGDMFSICFSSIIVTAAAADARYKVVRRNDLDGAILRTKEELRALGAEQQMRLHALGMAASSDHELREDYNLEDSSRFNEGQEEVVEEKEEKTVALTQEQPLLPSKDDASAHERRRWPRIRLPKFDQKKVPEDPLMKRPAGPCEDLNAPLRTSGGQKDHTTKTRSHRKVNTESRPGESKSRGNPETIGQGYSSKVRGKQKASKSARNPDRRYRNHYWAKIDTTNAAHDTLTRILLNTSPLDPCIGRSIEEVWASRSTPSISLRNTLQRENAIATLIYEIVLTRVNKTESVRVSLYDGTSLNFTRDHTRDLYLRLEDLRHRRSILISAGKDRQLTPMIQPLGLPPFQWMHSSRRAEEIKGVAQQEEELIDLFSSPMEMDELISRLCSTLACQKYPPNIHMFNIIIIRLCHLQLHKLARLVIKAMEDCGVTANEVTHAAVLNCFAALREAREFHGYINRMEGTSGRGMTSIKGYDSSQERGPESKILSHPPAIHLVQGFIPEHTEARVQYFKAPRTQYIYEAIVAGFLKLSRVESALEEYAKMIRQGFQPTDFIYQSFIKYCVEMKAWKLGRLIWSQFNDGSRTVDATMYYWMLQLCAFCQKRIEFKTINNEAVRKGILKIPLHYKYFMWSEKDYLATVEHANAVDRLVPNLWVPGSVPSIYDIDYEATIHKASPGNLFTLVRQQFLNLVYLKEQEAGFCVDEIGRDQLALISAESLDEQWVQRDPISGETVLTPKSKWAPDLCSPRTRERKSRGSHETTRCENSKDNVPLEHGDSRGEPDASWKAQQTRYRFDQLENKTDAEEKRAKSKSTELQFLKVHESSKRIGSIHTEGAYGIASGESDWLLDASTAA